MSVLLDAGPLVAYFDQREARHIWARETMARLHPPLLTCEAVLTEACHLLHKRVPTAISRLESWFARDLIQLAFNLEENWPRVFGLMQTYADLPMSLADACLVTMIENGTGDRIFTLDQHFRIYRHSGRRVLPVLMPV
jgi:predicted nucleic acid-binding protein